MTDILSHLKKHIAKWRLALDGAPFETHSSWLALVTHRGKPALLKVYKPKSDEGRGVATLLHWGRPAVRVLEHDEAAVIVERAVPGTTLVDMVAHDDDGATNIWCDTVLALHDRPAPEGFATLWDCGRSFNKPWPRNAVLTQDLFERGKAAYFELCETQNARRFLLHTDLHHANVLKDDTLGWLVIDPKGYAGEIEFETASFLHNPTREYCAPKHLARRVRIVAERLTLDPERLLRWVFAHGVLAALWSVEMPVFDPIGGVEAANAALAVLGHKTGS
ncbi:MAG TPA: aminoglycoside phosphotransferase family protein [Rhizomicrobium sp.]|jgi:streptomycin 6-kinase|nr:aminoglycoside phosphotransferase family protein [Rhizomicrobium sp.]